MPKKNHSFRGFYIVLIAMAMAVSACVPSIKEEAFGARDPVSAAAIDRINALSALRYSGRYGDVKNKLSSDLKSFDKNGYAQARIFNELSDIYSNHLLDLELAVEQDDKLQALTLVDRDFVGGFLPKNTVANQQVVADKDYYNNYVGIKGDEIKAASVRRKANNLLLLSGEKTSGKKKYSADFINQYISDILYDISTTPSGSREAKRLYSRLIRAEYEMSQVNKGALLKAYGSIEKGNISYNEIDLSEIDFLSLADYFTRVYRQTGDIRFAEYALETIYRPYSNLRDPSNRWRYNKIVNEYISTLIEANYRQGNYADMLYYSSLNKSRMLLEEKIAFAAELRGKNNLNDLLAQNGIVRNPKSGLPDKDWFYQHLAQIDGLVDFYISGKYQQGHEQRQGRAERAVGALNTRDFGVEAPDTRGEQFVDESLYAFVIERGRVAYVEKLNGGQLGSLRAELDRTIVQISDKNAAQHPPEKLDRSSVLIRLGQRLSVKTKIAISPDKWLARHPLDFHLGIKGYRTVNVFTYAKPAPLRNISLIGFFNPTLDLAGSDHEAEAIEQTLSGAQIFKRSAASVSALQSAQTANIVHLSMHGAFNSNDPRASKLYFAGARRGLAIDDPNALYARDMGRYELLRNRDLVFAAACETGKIAADQTNENELTGILRPLTANNNRNVILSLWKVDDEATQDFVTTFYRYLNRDLNIPLAFEMAQDFIRDRYRHPYYWAAFYLSSSR